MTPMRFSRVKIENDFREVGKIAAAAALREELATHRPPGVGGGRIGMQPKRQPAEPPADE